MLTITYEDGHLLFTSYTKSAKVANLRDHPDVACVVMSSSDHDAAWVSVQGRAEVYQPCRSEVDALFSTASVPDTRVPDSVVAKARHRLLTGQRCIIRVKVNKVVAADLGPEQERDDVDAR